MTIEIKTPEQLAVMREAGLVVARTLNLLAAAVSTPRVRPTSSPASRIAAICSGVLISISTYLPSPLPWRPIPGRSQRTNGRSAAIARLVTSSTGPVASMPIRMFSSA